MTKIKMLKIGKFHILTTIILLVLSLPPSLCSAEDEKPLPLSVRRVLYQAQTLIEEKRLEEARLQLEAYRLRKKRTHYMIEFTLGDIWMLTEAYPQAAEAYRKALDLQADFAPAWMNLGKAAYEMTNYPTAADCFYKAYQRDAAPHPERLYYSATAHLLAEQPRQGLTMFQTLLDKHPDAVALEWKPTLVQLYLALDQPLDALPVIEELAERSAPPKRARWQETLIGHYLLLGKTDRALAYTRTLTRTEPTVPRWWKAQAHLLLEQQDYEAALQALIIFTKLTDPGKTEKRLLADLNLQVGIPALAAYHYRELADESPDTEIVTRLTHALRLLGRQTEALQRIDSYLEKGTTPDLLWLKGELLYELKKYPAAAETFRRCAQEPSLAGRAWLMAGYASWQAKDIPAAKRELSRARAYPAQKKSAGAALKELENISADTR